MAAKGYIVIPGTSIRLYDGDIVKISNKPNTNWIVHNGWYSYNSVQNYGWYLVDTRVDEILPASIIDLTLCTLVKSKTVGSEKCDGKVVDYAKPFTEADLEILNRTFISVDTIAQRDNLDKKTLTNGRIVRVNSTPNGVSYYAWSVDRNVWDVVDFGSGAGIPEVIGTPDVPAILSNLKEGLYRVIGDYLVSPYSDFKVSTKIHHLVFVSGENPILVKVITESTITDYQVTSSQELLDKYAYQSYVDNKVSALASQISEIISELSAASIAYNPPPSGATSSSLNVQDAIDALNDAITGQTAVLYGTTEHWNSRPQLIAERGCIYVYSDHSTDGFGNDLAGLKVGDGRSYLIDMPFIDKNYAEHIVNSTIHVSAEDREFWDNKVTCILDPVSTNTLILTKNKT